MGLAITFLPVHDVAELASGFKIMIFMLINGCVIVLRSSSILTPGTIQSGRHLGRYIPRYSCSESSEGGVALSDGFEVPCWGLGSHSSGIIHLQRLWKK